MFTNGCMVVYRSFMLSVTTERPAKFCKLVKGCVCTYNSRQHPVLLRVTFTFYFSTRRSVCNRWLQRSQDSGCSGEVQSRGGGVEGSCSSCVWPERPRHSRRPPLARQVHHEELLGARITTLTFSARFSFFTTSTCHTPPFAANIDLA